jgi:hypothetical protein
VAELGRVELAREARSNAILHGLSDSAQRCEGNGVNLLAGATGQELLILPGSGVVPVRGPI